jgi:hypothetical protein
MRRRHSHNLQEKQNKKDETPTEFNERNSSIKFTTEKEHNFINFLDPTLCRKGTKLEFEIYRKSTQTDTIIPNDS